MNKIKRIIETDARLSMVEKLGLGMLSALLEDRSTIVELGTNTGGSANIFLQTGKKHIIHTIDIFDQIDNTTLDRTKIHFHNGYAADFIKNNATNDVDLLFIDGHHALLSAATDFITLSHILKNDGIIVFHDCCCGWPGVKALGMALVENKNIYNEYKIDSLLIGVVNKTKEFPNSGLIIKKVLEVAEEIDKNGNSHFLSISGVRDFLNSGAKAYLIGKGRCGEQASKALGIYTEFVDSQDVRDTAAVCFVFSCYYEEIRDFLINKKNIPGEQIYNYSFFDIEMQIKENHEILKLQTSDLKHNNQLLDALITELTNLHEKDMSLLQRTGVLRSVFFQV